MSTGQARRQFRELLEMARSGEVVEITRRGEPVAVVVSPAVGARLDRTDPWERMQAWRRTYQPERWIEDDDPFADVRSGDVGRPVRL